ncbi:MAG: CoA-binding protein [Flavobacteriaceae bacterium]|nr:CoA-binding protein [Flavobacteriaceae bacterium]|tara:strand:- start:18020 stop:18382 length:363 start_codon:yes stop_codon:yes gene_type:complete
MDKKTLVIGASTNPNRYSFKAIHKLLANNIQVKAIGVKKGEVGGIPIEEEGVIFEDIHTITLYVNPKIQRNYYDYIVNLNPKRVIFNPGTENPELAELLEENGIDFENACTLVLLSINQY